MSSMMPAAPTLQGIPAELRDEIYGLVADDPSRKPIILGRKVAQAVKQFLFDGDIREQALSAIVQHPLEMTCQQMRAEFQAGFNVDYARSQTYELVVDNFDFEQFRLFEELQHAKYGDCMRAVKSYSQITRDRKLVWMRKVSFELRLQMDHNVVASVTALANSLVFCSEGKERSTNVPNSYGFLDVNNFTMSFKHRTHLGGIVNPAETMETVKAQEALKTLRTLKKKCSEPMVCKLLNRFTGLLDAHEYLESQH
ncbi:hypothetical protein MBLNU13_g07904t1 [Cladosporium sp. NU13]